MLDAPAAQGLIASRQADLERESRVSLAALVNELKIIAHSSHDHFRVGRDGHVTAGDPELLRAIKSVDYKMAGREMRPVITTHDKVGAIRLLSQLFGYLPHAAPAQGGPGVIVVRGFDAALVMGEKGQSRRARPSGAPPCRCAST